MTLPSTELRCIWPHPDFPGKRCNKLFGAWRLRLVIVGTVERIPDDEERLRQDDIVFGWIPCDRCHRVSVVHILPPETSASVATPSPQLPPPAVGSRV